MQVLLQGYPNGEFAEGRQATRAEAVKMILRQLEYNRQGIAADIKLKIAGGRSNQPTIDAIPIVPLQVVDNTLYVSLRNVFFDITNWSRANHWQPVEQSMYFDYDVQFGYTAGTGTNEFLVYGSKNAQLLQPVRILTVS